MKISSTAQSACFLLPLCLMLSLGVFGQSPLFTAIPVSDSGTENSIGNANTSRNLAIDLEGNLYVAYRSSNDIKVAKSVDRGASFLPSVSVTNGAFEPEITVNHKGVVFVAWTNGQSIYLSKSNDEGLTFSEAILVGSATGEAVHMTTFHDNLFLVDRVGSNLFRNDDQGLGEFTRTAMQSRVYADIRTDQNGTVYFPADDPSLYLFESRDSGLNYSPIILNPPGRIYYSSYALSDGPCGTFIFVAGGGSTPNQGYKIDVSDGTTTPMVLGDNSGNEQGRTLYADNRGTLIDGYRSSNGNLMMNVSYDQGENFDLPIVLANGVSHNITRNPVFDDVVVVYEKEGRIFVSVYDGLLKNIRITKEDFPSFCAGDIFHLPFQVSGDFDNNTLFSVYLSDSNGSFENKTLVGKAVADENGFIVSKIPDGTVSSEAYRIQIESKDNCVQSNSVHLTVGTLSIKQPLPLLACEDDANGIYAFFDTSGIETEVLNGLTGMKVEYFDSTGNTLPNPLPNPYTNSVPYNDEITIKVSKPDTSCFSETILYLEVYERPKITSPETLYNCDFGDGFSSFDTANIETQLVGSHTDWIVSYFDENGGELPSPLPTVYENSRAWQETINVKVAHALNPLCYSETTFDVVVNRFPEVELQDNYTFCALDASFYISADTDFDSWQWRDENGVLLSNTFEADLVQEGRYSLTLGKTINDVYCERDFKFSLTRSELPRILEIRFTELSNDNSIEIQATEGLLEYSIDGIHFQKEPLFQNVRGGIYTAIVRDRNGCGQDEEEVVIVDYPKFFTPNNDGTNDFWQIEGIERYPDAIVYIFDRYGKLLQRMRADDIGWNGMLKGKNLISSDYWFRVDLEETKNFSGHFSLKR